MLPLEVTFQKLGELKWSILLAPGNYPKLVLKMWHIPQCKPSRVEPWSSQTSSVVNKCLRHNVWITKVLRQHSRRVFMKKTVWLMSMLAFKGGRTGLRTGPVTFLWWSVNTNDGAFLYSHCDEHSTPVRWYRELCFSASSQWGHSGVSKEGHLGVLLLKAIAWLFISGFVQKGSHTRYLVHSCLW